MLDQNPLEHRNFVLLVSLVPQINTLFHDIKESPGAMIILIVFSNLPGNFVSMSGSQENIGTV